MKPRMIFIMFFIVGSFGSSLADEPAGIEPPIRLRKKEKPQAPLKDKPRSDKLKDSASKPPDTKPRPAGAPGSIIPQAIEQDPKKALARLSQNLREAEERLARKDAGAKTQEAQHAALLAMEALIQEAHRQRQPNSQSSPAPKPDSREQTQQQARASGRTAAQKQPTPKDASSPRAGKRPSTQDSQSLSKIADLYKDVWGHLPETMRQEMDQYSRERFMSKYSDSLKQYYATIAEKGHRKGD